MNPFRRGKEPSIDVGIRNEDGILSPVGQYDQANEGSGKRGPKNGSVVTVQVGRQRFIVGAGGFYAPQEEA